MRQLRVWLNDKPVGLLSEQDNLWLFQHEPAWLSSAEAFDLSPQLPRAAGAIRDGASQRPVQWFFDNLLPEEQARTLLAQDAHVEVADAFALLAYYGAESAGALTLLGPEQGMPTRQLQPLATSELARRIDNLPRVSLGQAAPKRMSLAGAQHKLAVVLQAGELFEPVGQEPSTHILKPDHADTDSYPHSAANEWFVMALAAAVKLPVPPVELRRVPQSIYLVQRFDRHAQGGMLQRRHVLDACQLLSFDRIYKYRMATLETLQQLVALCRSKAMSRQLLFRWALFNALLGNNDAHLKNLSFFVGAQGIELAPHYDLLSTSVYARDNAWGHAELSWPMGNARRFAELTRADVLAFGAVLGLPGSVSTRLLDTLLAALPGAADRLLEQALQNGLSAGELRLLRQVRHGVLTDMLQQLR
ncbi:HipA domain-containing protein [Aquipseudomonas ullengensis]|uniref:HipA domain-containing protein n=1 Tax=Aquipseudomonas ullengensis TaxID=2759166 RepID=A0A7W4QEW8_9GAMM|nr:HipA domain-containing protein [Pseudomonas ullengensis]MBB2496008.1 HipA domain-containing protein [Pseudomonas ullengensis]